jgi:adenylate kinase
VAAGTEIGNKAKEFMNAGRLVPDEIVTAVVSTIAHFDFILCSCSIFIC